MPEFMDLTASFYSLVNGLRACIYRIGGIISDVYPHPLRFSRRRRIQGRVDECNFVLVKSNGRTVLIEDVEVAFSYLENGKHLTNFDVPVWVKSSAGADVAYSHGLTSLM